MEELGFEPVAEYFQFAVSVDEKDKGLKVKIDFLSPPVGGEE